MLVYTRSSICLYKQTVFSLKGINAFKLLFPKCPNFPKGWGGQESFIMSKLLLSKPPLMGGRFQKFGQCPKFGSFFLTDSLSLKGEVTQTFCCLSKIFSYSTTFRILSGKQSRMLSLQNVCLYFNHYNRNPATSDSILSKNTSIIKSFFCDLILLR